MHSVHERMEGHESVCAITTGRKEKRQKGGYWKKELLDSTERTFVGGARDGL